ncbi:MAG: hypothetical protein ACLTSG_14355 [Lachnospiraceae bacterium]
MEAQMLKDKVAIITGASYGMGRLMAELSRRGRGSRNHRAARYFA